MTIWLVGQYKPENWEFQGVFYTKELALAACKNRNYFFAPVTLDKEVSEFTVEMPNVEYPLA